jgi:PKD repeat protein
MTVTVSAANVPPAVSFSYSCTRLNCKFTDTSTDSDGSIASRLWNFGDGSTSTARNPYHPHKFSDSGTYTVMLTVTDDGGASSSASETVTVSR